MPFELPSDVAAMVEEIRAYSAEHLAPAARDRSRSDEFPRDVAQLLAGKGWSGMPCATGTIGGVLAGVAALEAVTRACPRSGDAFHQLNFGASLLLGRYAASDRHRAAFAAVADGTALVPIAITEENAGAQAAATQSFISDGVLNGHKVYCSNSTEADAFVVYANFGKSVGTIGAVLVERARPGVRIGAPNIFMNGESWCRLDFDNVAIAEDDVIFSSGGFVDRAGFFDIEKLGNAARALGLGWCAYDLARAQAAKRQQFGRPICEFQGIQWKIAEARLQLEAAELMLYRAASRADDGRLTGDEASMAKIHCNRAAMATSDMAVQVMGASGFSDITLAEYCFRKARGHMINGGTIEMMLTRVAEGAFDRKFPQQAA